jgi:hypothetical protein
MTTASRLIGTVAPWASPGRSASLSAPLDGHYRQLAEHCRLDPGPSEISATSPGGET